MALLRLAPAAILLTLLGLASPFAQAQGPRPPRQKPVEPSLQSNRPIPNAENVPQLMSGASARAEQTVRLFFPRDGMQNPGGSAPNWYFYWSQGVVSGLQNFTYKPGPYFGSYSPASDTFEINDAAPTQNDGPINVTNKYTNAVRGIGAGGAGIHSVAETIAHEKEHQRLHKRLTGVDSDGDGLSDADEEGAYAAYGFRKNDPDTYNLAATIDPSYASYGDEELLARVKESSPVATNPAQDWSDTNGQNWSAAGGDTAPIVTAAPELASVEGVPALLEFLEDPRPRVVNEAVERLAASGDPEAIRPLRERALRDRPAPGIDGGDGGRLPIIDALGRLGETPANSGAARDSLLAILNEYTRTGPLCGCERCGGEGLYPWHDGAYMRVMTRAITRLRPWAAEEAVSSRLLEIALDHEQVKSGPIRRLAYRVYLQGRHAGLPPRERAEGILSLQSQTPRPAPENSFLIQGNVGRPTTFSIQHQAITDVYGEMGEEEANHLRELLAAETDQGRRLAIQSAIESIAQAAPVAERQ